MKALIIDDDDLVRKSLKRALAMRGHEVTEASNGLEGLALWKTHSPDLVVLDVLMPEMSGIEVLQSRPVESRAKVVMISAFTGHESPEHFQNLGASKFIAKPFSNIFQTVEDLEKEVGD